MPKLHECKLIDSHFRGLYFNKADNMHTMSLICCTFTENVTLQNMHGLQQLTVCDTKFRSFYLKNISTQENLELCGCIFVSLLSFENIPTLRTLVLDNCTFTGGISFKKVPVLKYISLRGISASDFSHIFDELRTLRRLKRFSIENCADLTTIFRGICEMNGLVKLKIVQKFSLVSDLKNDLLFKTAKLPQYLQRLSIHIPEEMLLSISSEWFSRCKENLKVLNVNEAWYGKLESGTWCEKVYSGKDIEIGNIDALMHTEERKRRLFASSTLIKWHYRIYLSIYEKMA